MHVATSLSISLMRTTSQEFGTLICRITVWCCIIATTVYVRHVLAGKQKIHYTFTDGSEMVEEYDLRNYDLLGNHCLLYVLVIFANYCLLVLTSASFQVSIKMVVLMGVASTECSEHAQPPQTRFLFKGALSLCEIHNICSIGHLFDNYYVPSCAHPWKILATPVTTAP